MCVVWEKEGERDCVCVRANLHIGPPNNATISNYITTYYQTLRSGVARGGARGAIAPPFFLEKRNAKCNSIKSSYENNTATTQRLRGPRAVLFVFLL